MFTKDLDRWISAAEYVRKIRNAEKRAYAQQLYDACLVLRGKRGEPEVDRPEALSGMGAQAVRMQLDKILRKE